jgi:hypothetical protein
MIETISNPIVSNILSIIITAGVSILVTFARRTSNRIKLAEYKHIATMYALEKQFDNGFMFYYNEKLTALKEDNKFKMKGE